MKKIKRTLFTFLAVVMLLCLSNVPGFSTAAKAAITKKSMTVTVGTSALKIEFDRIPKAADYSIQVIVEKNNHFLAEKSFIIKDKGKASYTKSVKYSALSELIKKDNNTYSYQVSISTYSKDNTALGYQRRTGMIYVGGKSTERVKTIYEDLSMQALFFNKPNRHFKKGVKVSDELAYLYTINYYKMYPYSDQIPYKISYKNFMAKVDSLFQSHSDLKAYLKEKGIYNPSTGMLTLIQDDASSELDHYQATKVTQNADGTISVTGRYLCYADKSMITKKMVKGVDYITTKENFDGYTFTYYWLIHDKSKMTFKYENSQYKVISNVKIK